MVSKVSFVNILFWIFVSHHFCWAQTNSADIEVYKKSYVAKRMAHEPKIDGDLSDVVWDDLDVADQFSMLAPKNGDSERESHRTEFKVGYTDEAVYIAAYMYDQSGLPIRKEITQRDNVPQTDYIVLDINTYNDGENQNRFVVTTAGGMADAKMKATNQDFDYNVIWDAKVSSDSVGWYAEIKIPFVSLRFPKMNEQVWSMQLGRVISSLNEVYVWSQVDKTVGIITHYNGLLTGIKNINPPFRLGFYPFVSGSADHYKNRFKKFFNAGMDIKYGIDDAFTLDLTLIPDFGQTAYDDIELNLGPFEQTFGEKRAFFTEGIELFSKGNLFYSRRIGAKPIGFDVAADDIGTNELLLENPEETTLLNAFKISGRNQSGLGVGFFNAITAKESARYMNIESGRIREKITAPLTNYNVLVLDQQFKNKSSISFVNTNTFREGGFTDANVSAGLFDVFTKNSTFNISGEVKMSQLLEENENNLGFASQLSIQRSRGKFRYGVAHEFADKKFDINDLGVNFMNNYNNFFWNTSYQIFEPQGGFNQYKIEFYGNHQRNFQPDIVVRTGIGTKFSAVTAKKFAFGGFLDYNSKYRDFFETRTKNRYMLYPENFIGDLWIATDNRKSFIFDARFLMSQFIGSDFSKASLTMTPTYRVSEQISFQYNVRIEKENNRDSYVDHIDDDIIFGSRDRISLENSFQALYNLTTENAISLSFRNFWTVAEFEPGKYARLESAGGLTPANFEITDANNPNARFNIWNLDLRYSWRFAPGSELAVLYRNAVSILDQQQNSSFLDSANFLFAQPIKHSISIRLMYYLDYNTIRNIF
ncbi:MULTISPECIES: DUF5916 domain-containing protein [Gelidibacter]|jgi:hypothetical protein|uniref:DUF5916 domain-containing protein n=1 Tax=Gelidibacter TaxID=49279 RepID=UPI001FF30528|nr:MULTISPECIES: DUF5916 domain-containing protein [Gelidibacter]MCK0115274.1 carbohydrate binding family 9 domain-containing protein [Gelidibacter sp. F63206]